MVVRVRITQLALSFLAGACVVMMYNAVRREERSFSQKIVLSSSNKILQSDKLTGQSDRHELSTENTDVEMSKNKDLPECKHQTEFRRFKVPPVDPKIWDKVNYVLLFIGYFRSGHSLVSSLLDAHPNIVISDENHVVRMWRTLPEERKTRNHLFQTIYEQSYKQAVVGQRSTKDCYPSVNYKYQVPNQYQGRFDKFIQVIGDKQGPLTVKVLEYHSNGKYLLSQMKQATKIPFKFIHVVRNPFDIVATQVLRDMSWRISNKERERFFQNQYNDSKDIQYIKAKQHVQLTKGVMNLIKLSGDDVISVYSEDMINDPRKELKRVCQFLSVSCSENYLKDCASIVFGSPSKSRNAIVWKDRTKKMLTDLISKTPMLQRYKFNED